MGWTFLCRWHQVEHSQKIIINALAYHQIVLVPREAIGYF
jgi:hypothetical protein